MVSLLLVDLHPNKIPLFLRCQECQKCIGIGGQNMEIKVVKIVVDVAEIKVY